MKLCPIDKCRACGYAAWTPNTDFDPKGRGENRSRIYVGCHKVEPCKAFDYGTNIYGPESIPDWCPLPDAPEGTK